MFFGSPEHLTFLRYEVLSPQRRYDSFFPGDNLNDSALLAQKYQNEWLLILYMAMDQHVTDLCTTC